MFYRKTYENIAYGNFESFEGRELKALNKDYEQLIDSNLTHKNV